MNTWVDCLEAVNLTGLPLLRKHIHVYVHQKLPFYLDDADITLRSIHFYLWKFLERNTLNSKINNWAVENEQYWIKYEID